MFILYYKLMYSMKQVFTFLMMEINRTTFLKNICLESSILIMNFQIYISKCFCALRNQNRHRNVKLYNFDIMWYKNKQKCILLILFFFAVCNFVVHERCLNAVVSPCSSVAASLIKVTRKITKLLAHFGDFFPFSRNKITAKKQ